MDLGWFEVSLDVKDITRSLDFYGKLGFEVMGRELDGRVVVVQKADCRICLYERLLDPPETQLIFWQGDVTAIALDLQRQGLRFEKAPSTGDGNGIGALLRDPDGNPLFFVTVPGVTRLEGPQSPAPQQAELETRARQFFDEFVEAFLTFSGSTIAERYVAPYLAFHTQGAADAFGSSTEISAYFQKVVDGYHAGGCRSCRYRDLDVAPLGRECAVATVTWELLTADSAVLEAWRESYNLCLVRGRFKVYASTDHVA